MVTITVQVLSNKTGKPVSGRQVSVGCDELMALWTTKRQSSNSDGIAQFSVARDNFKGSIYVNGTKVFEGKVTADNTVFSD
jgi:hypothetical protein